MFPLLVPDTICVCTSNGSLPHLRVLYASPPVLYPAYNIAKALPATGTVLAQSRLNITGHKICQ